MDWQIFNRPDIGNSLEYSFASLFIKIGSGSPFSSVLERRILPPYDEGPEGLGFANVPGLPRFAEARFLGSFPTSRIEFEHEGCPVKVALDAFSPFQPLDADASGLPCTVLTYEVHNLADVAAEAVVAWSLINPIDLPVHSSADAVAGTSTAGKPNEDTRTNEARTSEHLSGLFMTNPMLPSDDPMHGSFAIAALPGVGGKVEILPRWQGGSTWRVGPQHFWFDEFSKSGSLGAPTEPSSPVGCVSIRKTIAPGATEHFRFVLAWHFPNRTPQRCGWLAAEGKSNAVIGNYYCTKYSDAWTVAEYASENLPELERKTRAFVVTLQDSTLPDVIKEAASANLSTLVSNTSFRMADGSFQGFEGCGDHRGLGFGTCTHVWNYEVATQFVFPALSRSMRETSFTYATNAEGHMDFRHELPPSDNYWGAAAADGQMGQIVKLYFDWIFCGDDVWLRKLWPAAKRAMAYAWRPGGWDERKSGVMDGVQHCTYDVELYGPNPMCGSWYLAALRAISLMARAMGDTGLAQECQRMFEEGSRWIDENLFRGDYYVQQVRPIPEADIASGLRTGKSTKDPLHPEFQIGDGCLIDQLVGQYMASVSGLGNMLDPEHIRKTLASIYRLNYKRNLLKHSSVQRVYALNDEAGIVICDYSEGKRPEIPMPYYAEVMTGFEYSAAALMLANGMIAEGAECIANIRRRYDGERANPYDEAEYGRHYARAMASWAPIPLLCGFQFDARKQSLQLAPQTQADAREFRSFWSTATAWGSFSLRTDRLTIVPVDGVLMLKELRVKPAFTGQVRATLGGASVEFTHMLTEQISIFDFASPVAIMPQRPLLFVAR